MTTLSQNLINWYRANRRALPWRQNRDPYQIWISEVMLQQTTVVAVIPYYQKFLQKFPTVKKLAQAPLPEVLEAWAGLGYYSRARNLHKAAQVLAKNGFPQKAEKLIELPGFGPYTSRAVSSLAFSEAVGVLDGNVIRVLSRVFGQKSEWWSSKGREHLQNLSDQLAQQGPSEDINQGLMELGATVCTPTSPTCLLCPWRKECVALKNDLIAELPLKKQRKASEVWVWKVQVLQNKQNKFAFIVNNYAPFLKGALIFPGTIEQQAKKPKVFALKHGITHHDIYIEIQTQAQKNFKAGDNSYQWLSAQEVKKINPSSVLQKILHSKSDLQAALSSSQTVARKKSNPTAPKPSKKVHKKSKKLSSKL